MTKRVHILLTALMLSACNFYTEINTDENDTQTPTAPTIILGEDALQLATSAEAGLWLQPAIDGVYDSIAWILDGEYIGSSPKMHIVADEGRHTLRIEAYNQSAHSFISRPISVMPAEQLPLYIHITQYEYTTVVGSPIRITPIVSEPRPLIDFRWAVNGIEVKCSSEEWLDFCPDSAGYYDIRLTADYQVIDFGVTAIPPSEVQYRPRTSDSDRSVTRVIEYLPAPGQFINTGMGGRTPEQYALDKLQAGEIFSLGGFGGGVVVGFDHSIANNEGADFRIRSNSFDNSSEPGVVWVMQDLNGNGKCDEIWYELKGSETDNPTTRQNIAITYIRNAYRALGNIQWRGSDGSCGVVERNPYHTTNNYYPEWIPHSLTLCGTMLEPKVEQSNGNYVSLPYGWGYVDNLSEECVGGWNSFDIANAIAPDGSSVNLPHIDFIKVQSAVCYSAPVIGEISTEISAIEEIFAK